jgi:hypothetical protein
MLKSWAELPGYKDFVKDKWRSFSICGWGGFVLKEKLKMIKNSLKEWHTSHGRNAVERLKKVKERRQILETKGESEELLEYEREEMLFLSSQVFSMSKMVCCNRWQKSSLIWLKEGDANTKFFHSVMTSRKRSNALSSVLVDDVVIEGVSGIRTAVFTHFENHFRSVNIVRPQIDNLQFNSISTHDAYFLERPFGEEEVKQVVWDCDSFKSPGPDGVNFCFVKEF